MLDFNVEHFVNAILKNITTLAGHTQDDTTSHKVSAWCGKSAEMS